MQYHEFVERVAARSGLERDEAARSADAVFQVLGETLSPDERRAAGSQLPSEIQFHLYRRRGASDRITSLDAFYRALMQQLDIDQGAAEARALAVLSVLAEAVSVGELEDLHLDLPPEFASILQRKQTPGRGAA